MYPEEVIRYISGNYSEMDKKMTDRWISEDPVRKEEVKQLQLLWRATEDLDFQIDVDDAWNNVENKLEVRNPKVTKLHSIGKKRRKKSSNFVGYMLKIAAVLFIAAGAYSFYLYQFESINQNEQKEQITYHTVSSEDGEKVQYRFNDGSKVVLNSGSQLRYRSDFGTGTRELELKGEAYFEVNHHHDLPFIVHTNDITVRDIGTKFNINTYPDKELSKVVVSEGLVEVHSNVNNPSQNNGASGLVRLSQGQKVELDKGTGEMVVGKADLHTSLAWLDNRLVFDEESFEEVTDRLERFYDVNIQIEDRDLRSKEITASFNDESLENVLKVLSLSLDAEYETEGRTVIFKK